MPPKHMTEDERNIFPEEVLKALAVSTEATAKDLATDDWDSEFNCSYSADGRKLLDAENFPDEVTVRDGVQIICDNVFSFQDYMAEDYHLGSDIPEEDRVSFLDKITLPPSVEHIGAGAFKECGWITSIKFPKSLLTIRDNAFYGCWELRSAAFPANLTSIGERAFFECFSLEKVRLNKGLKVIGSEAFSFCESLKEITLPAGLVAIGEDAFFGCRKLKKIFVPAGTLEMYRQILPTHQRYLKEY